MTRSSRNEVFAGKTIEELEAMTKDLDRDFIVDTFRPLTPAERKLWLKSKRKRGRPVVGKGAKVVSISIERDLLARSDKAARRLKVSRAKLVAAGLRRVLEDLESSAGRKPKRRGRAA
jgi:hypothetical protein